MDADRTTAAESLNARIETTVPQIRTLGSDHFVPYLNERFALLNTAILPRRHVNTDDVEDEDFHSFLRSYLICACCSCSPYEKVALLQRDKQCYGIRIDEICGNLTENVGNSLPPHDPKRIVEQNCDEPSPQTGSLHVKEDEVFVPETDSSEDENALISSIFRVIGPTPLTRAMLVLSLL